MLMVSRGADCAWFNARSGLILFNGVWGDDSLVRACEGADLTLEVGTASAGSGDGAAGSSVSVIVFESMLSFFFPFPFGRLRRRLLKREPHQQCSVGLQVKLMYF